MLPSRPPNRRGSTLSAYDFDDWGKSMRASFRSTAICAAILALSMIACGQPPAMTEQPGGDNHGFNPIPPVRKVVYGKFAGTKWAMTVYRAEKDGQQYVCWTMDRDGLACSGKDSGESWPWYGGGTSWNNHRGRSILIQQVTERARRVTAELNNGKVVNAPLIHVPNDVRYPWEWFVMYLPSNSRGDLVVHLRNGKERRRNLARFHLDNQGIHVTG